MVGLDAEGQVGRLHLVVDEVAEVRPLAHGARQPAAGGPVSREALAGKSASNERAVDVQINRLRRKIERDPAHPLLLQTVRGSGYRLLVEP